MRIIIIGVGNPNQSDDGIGIKVARLLKKKITAQNGIEISELYTGGLKLLDKIKDVEKAVPEVVEKIIAECDLNYNFKGGRKS